jgi:aminoglycoside 3-N-acetyltransferase
MGIKTYFKKIIPGPIIRIVKQLQKLNRKRDIKKNAPMITKNNIKTDLTKLGISNGDCILLHSSLKSIGYVENGANTVIDALIENISQKGTLVVPTYPLLGTMLKTCLNEDYIFDMNKSSTTIGAIPSVFLGYKNIIRSIHPTHSMSALGKNAESITKNHHIGNETYGKNSPWAKIVELDGKILGVGISLAWHTIYHHVEDIMGNDFPIKVKRNQFYKINCKTIDGELLKVEVNPLDPKVAKTRIEKNPFILDYFTEIYEKLGIIQYGKIGEAKSWIVNAKEFCDVLIRLAKLGLTIYSTEEEVKERKLFPFDQIKEKINL